jgi:hypothetical protein
MRARTEASWNDREVIHPMEMPAKSLASGVSCRSVQFFQERDRSAGTF